jgi:hypothetical protein
LEELIMPMEIEILSVLAPLLVNIKVDVLVVEKQYTTNT